jgi:signal transduction histidine kinase
MNVPLQDGLPSISSAGDSGSSESRTRGSARTVSARPTPATAGLLLGLVLAIGWVDYVTGLELSVSLLYLIPIAIGTWVTGRTMGYTLALASTAVWFAADLLKRHEYGHWFVPLWNTLTLALSFLVVAVLFGLVREANKGLERKVLRRTSALQAENAQRRQAEQGLTAALGEARDAHAELQRTQAQLIEAAKKESVARLATGVAHEVKNPLMTLSLGVDFFLSRKPQSPEEAQLALDMKEAVRRASNVINILLDYARPRPLERTSEDIHDVIDNSLTLVRHHLNKQRVKVVREFHTGLPPLMLDRTRIEQVFVNLFFNAMQAMPFGGMLTVRTSSSAFCAEETGTPAGVSVVIEDTGHGITPENAGKLFEPFFTTKPPGQGTGLGLTIARKILEMHGGSILLNNRDQGGAQAILHFQTKAKDQK